MISKMPHFLLSLHHLQSYSRPEVEQTHDDTGYNIDEEDEEDSGRDTVDKMNSSFRRSKGAGDNGALGDNYVHSSDADDLSRYFGEKCQPHPRSILHCYE